MTPNSLLLDKLNRMYYHPPIKCRGVLLESSQVLPVEPLYTFKQVCNWLQISPKTLRAYVKAKFFVNLVIIPHAERPRTLFPLSSVQQFIEQHRAGLPGPERAKRAYNRRIVKGKRKKKK